ncbi:MAG: GspE/PulE family protein [bacterium]|nr:GspE/PulE family protein [bacterium]
MTSNNQNQDLVKKDVTNLVTEIFIKAIERRASDIHLEPEDSSFNVRFRVDGLLYLVDKLSIDLKDPLISRIKVMSQLDITEHRLPQDGHIEFKNQDTVHNMRISTFPTLRGEAVVVRILDRKDIVMKIVDLGLNSNQLSIIQKLIATPFGIIVITGPTGSGKTSFLYSIINTLGTSDKNIVTIEDPVEFNIPGIRQSQVKESIGLDFAKAMRSVARQDPNVVMLGEIRDSDTAHMAFQASLSGALVLTTFHTFDVPGVVVRLLEMGIPRSVLAHAIKGVISMRLLRKICSECKTPRSFTPDENGNIQFGDSDTTSVAKCSLCHNVGYYGRTGIFEIVPFDNETKFRILEGISTSEMLTFFENKKFGSLWQSATDKINQGITTAEEVMRVIGPEPI